MVAQIASLPWVVDTSVLIDIILGDARFARSSGECLLRYADAGLVLSPVSWVELAPAFQGNGDLQSRFLARLGIASQVEWTATDTAAAHHLWAEQVRKKRSGHTGKRLVADVLIEAFAQRFQGLITCNPKHFTTVQVVVP